MCPSKAEPGELRLFAVRYIRTVSSLLDTSSLLSPDWADANAEVSVGSGANATELMME
jgi:hypothetical protein